MIGGGLGGIAPGQWSDDTEMAICIAEVAATGVRREGKTVLLHCVHAHTRTPAVAAVYGALVTGSTPLEALARVEAVLPSARPRESFVRELERMSLPLE